MRVKLPDLGLTGLPKWVFPTLWILSALALIPFVLIANARVSNSAKPRIEIIPDMDNQPRFKAQQANPFFADGRAMRPIVAGTVARGELREDDRLYRGMKDGDWATTNALPVTGSLLDRGRRQFAIYCSPCHGLTGMGDGMVARRADELAEGTWTPPSSLHTDLVRQRPDGYLFNVITNGIRNMPPYASQVAVEDRWAIVAFIRALQRSQKATLDDVPAEARSTLR